VDRANWERFRSGKLSVSRTLDLHGLTAQQAFHAVSDFLRAAQADGLRCVEIVTGRGSRGAGGVIRREFRDWLNRPDIRSLVLAAAHPHPANPGAVNVLLRRPKTSPQSGGIRGAERRGRG
jgi:DNA-nicking Smr family endonuclease